MGGEVIIIGLIFGAIFGVFYLYFSTRNKERLALIEKGADATIFVSGRAPSTVPFWKIFLINLALLFIGIGLAIFIAAILVDAMAIDDDVAYPGTIFLMSGIGLLAGFALTKKFGT